MNPNVYKDFYQFEWEHRAQLTSSLSVPIAAITVVGTGVAIMLQSFPYESNLTTKGFVAFSILAVIALVYSIYSVYKSIFGYKYKRIGTPLDYHNYYLKLLEHYADDTASADKSFDKNINKKIAEASEVNAKNNQTRSQHIYSALASLGVALIFTALASGFYITKKITEPEKTTNVKIINPIKLEEKTMTEDKYHLNCSTPPKPEPIPEPEPPENADIIKQ